MILVHNNKKEMLKSLKLGKSWYYFIEEKETHIFMLNFIPCSFGKFLRIIK